jgi:RND family efflux transporter MFP subunit
MWAWRVVFPGGGLLACLLVLWAAVHQTGPRDGSPMRQPAARSGPKPRPAGERVLAEGRVAARPGAEVTVGTEPGGLVVDLGAREKARVGKGDLLVLFRSADQEAAVAEAEARVAEADAELEYQTREFQRRARAPLDSQQFAAEAASGRRDYEVAVARRKAAAAVLRQCRSALDQTRVAAPIDGVIVACLVQPGEIAPPGARLVTVCDLTRTRIEAEVDEFDAQRVSLGADVTITAEGHRSVTWRGTVEEVPDRVTGRSIRPEDPGRPTDTGVLLVKIAPAEPIPLKLGQQVEVEIRVSPSPAPP